MKSVNDCLRVLLVDTENARSALLSQALKDQGYDVIARIQPGPHLLSSISRYMPDFVVIDTDSPSRDMLESMTLLNQHHPLPVVMFAEDDSDTVVREAISSGVSGYVAHNTDPERVRSIMKVAIARFREYQALKQELVEVKTELEKSKLMQKAKSLLMKHKGATEDEAHDAILKMSMEQNKTIVQIAENIVQVLEMEL